MKSSAETRSRIMFKATAIALIIVFGLLISARTMAETVSDNFDDNTKDKTLWGPDGGDGNGVLAERNQHLQYTTFGGFGETGTYRPLIANQGTYTEKWEVQIDVFSGIKTSDYKGGSVGIEIFRCDNRADYLLYGELYTAFGVKGFEGHIRGRDEVQLENVSFDNLPLNGSIWISFDSTTEIITLYYDIGSGWKPFGSFGITQPGMGGATSIGL